jgi:hypothetical protein
MKIFSIWSVCKHFIMAIVAKLSRHFLPSIRKIFSSLFSGFQKMHLAFILWYHFLLYVGFKDFH